MSRLKRTVLILSLVSLAAAQGAFAQKSAKTSADKKAAPGNPAQKAGAGALGERLRAAGKALAGGKKAAVAGRPGAVSSPEPALAIPYERYELPNGLEVLLHVDKSAPFAAVNVWYHVGAFHEKPGRTGFAHLFEHMMFQGSAHVRDDSHFRILESLGAPDINGTTDFDRTNYYETVPSNHLETALWMESDRMGFLLNDLTQEKLTNQIDVVQNERRQGTEAAPYGLAEEKFWQALFPSPHPYFGMVIGTMKDLEAASLEDVRGFFRTYYAPSNATLAIAGDFDPENAKKLVEKYFGSLKRGDLPPPPIAPVVRVDAEKRLTHGETIGKLPRIMLGWHSPAFFAPGDAAADLLALILGSGESALLEKRLVRELEIAQSVQVSQESLGAQSVFSVTVTGRPGVAPEKLLAETDAVLDRARRGEITAAELERARNRYETRFVRNLQKVGGRAEQLQSYNHFLNDPGYLAKDMARYRAVTLDDLTAFARDVLAPSKRVSMFAVPGEVKP